MDDEDLHVIRIKTETDDFILRGRPCEVSAFSFVQPDRNLIPKERCFFNSDKKSRFPNNTYDRLFRPPDLYNNKLHRDDRAHTNSHAHSKGLTVNEEEVLKTVPSLSSSEYGKRIDNEIDPRDRKHVRVAIVKTEFYRRTGINAKETTSLQDM